METKHTVEIDGKRVQLDYGGAVSESPPQAGSAVEFGTHIKFVPGPAKPKTLTWWVVNKYDDGHIGWVGWYSAWRKYGYFAQPATVYEQICLREIADFCERKTREHKQNAQVERTQKASKGEN